MSQLALEKPIVTCVDKQNKDKLFIYIDGENYVLAVEFSCTIHLLIYLSFKVPWPPQSLFTYC